MKNEDIQLSLMSLNVLGTKGKEQDITHTDSNMAGLIENENKKLTTGKKNMKIEPPTCVFIPEKAFLREMIRSIAYMSRLSSSEILDHFAF